MEHSTQLKVTVLNEVHLIDKNERAKMEHASDARIPTFFHQIVLVNSVHQDDYETGVAMPASIERQGMLKNDCIWLDFRL